MRALSLRFLSVIKVKGRPRTLVRIRFCHRGVGNEEPIPTISHPIGPGWTVRFRDLVLATLDISYDMWVPVGSRTD